MPPVGFEPTVSAGERPQAAHLLRSWFLYRCKVLTVKTYFIINLHMQMDTYIVDGLQQLCDEDNAADPLKTKTQIL